MAELQPGSRLRAAPSVAQPRPMYTQGRVPLLPLPSKMNLGAHLRTPILASCPGIGAGVLQRHGLVQLQVL